MNCFVIEYTSIDENGNEVTVFSQTNTPVEECGKTNASQRVVMDGIDYTKLLAAAQTATIEDAAAVMDPVEIAAVYGTTFAWTIFLSAIAYKVKVAKSVIKLA